MESLLKVPFLGFELVSCATSDFIQWAVGSARGRRASSLVAYLNAATFNLAADDPEFARLLRRHDCLYADGMSVVRATKRLGSPIAERINAADFIEEFFAACAASGLKVGLVGGRPGEAAGFADHFQKRFPALVFNFVHHGYFAADEAAAIAFALDQADPDLVLVGMGSPKQEGFVVDAAGVCRTRVWWSVGALFEYFSGSRRRAPVWMRRIGLEWMFRLMLEPKRLWRRYLVGNPKFLWRVFRRRAVP